MEIIEALNIKIIFWLHFDTQSQNHFLSIDEHDYKWCNVC